MKNRIPAHTIRKKELPAMPIPPPRKKQPRAPSALAGSLLSSNLTNMTGAAQPPPASPEPSQQAYRDLHDHN